MGNYQSLLMWPLRKLVYAALLTALGLTGAGLWSFLHEGNTFEASHRNAIKKLETENMKLKTALGDADNRLAATRTRIAASQLRADQAAKVAHDLEDLSGGLNRITTASDQLKENEDRLVRMKQMEAESRKRAADLDQELIHIQWEKDGIEIAMEKNRAEASTVATEESPLLFYARHAWTDYGTAVLIGVALLMLAPSLWRLWRFSRS